MTTNPFTVMTVWRDDRTGWMGDVRHDPSADEIRALFGTTILPLPFTSAAPATAVLAFYQARGTTIRFREARCARLGSPDRAQSGGQVTMTETTTVRFFDNDKGSPAGKLADAELHFAGGVLDGLKLVGFSVWERRGGGRNVTFPARQYSVNGERRSFALLRPVVDSAAQERVRDLILEAYAAHTAELETV